MPIAASMGLKKIFVFEKTSEMTQTTMPEATAQGWADLGDVYKDTCTLKDEDPSETKHESETSTKKIIQTEEGDTIMELSLMDPDMSLLTKYFGGSITGNAGARKWSRPHKLPYKEFAIMVFPEEGFCVKSACARIIPKFEITYSAKGIALVPMKITFIEPMATEEGVTQPTVS